MRFQASVLAVAASVALVSAQNTPNLSAVPSCAVPCFSEALPSSGCSVTDIKCQCTTGREPLTAALMKCVPTKCSPQELASKFQYIPNHL
ncbi:CFEM multi-domain protein [Pyrenophora tritici-repentis]|nr:CFEM multi-domain protein [Pyrenophora tritici-repentis]